MNKEAFEKWWEEEREEKSGSPRRPTRGEIWQYFHREFPREAVAVIIKFIREQAFEFLPAEKDATEQLERLWNGGETAAQESIPEEGMVILKELAKLATSGKLSIPGDARELSDRAMVLLHKKPACKPTVIDADHIVEKVSHYKACPKCKGSGKVPVIVGHQCNVFPCYHDRKPCPDCTEKDSIYQRKIGSEHYPSPDERTGQQRQGFGRRKAAGDGRTRRTVDRRD